MILALPQKLAGNKNCAKLFIIKNIVKCLVIGKNDKSHDK